MNNNRVKIIFLDIDGVLNSYNGWLMRGGKKNDKGYNLYKEHGLVLKYIIDQVPNVKIVLSSCWRYSKESVEKIKKFFFLSLHIHPEIIISKTPYIKSNLIDNKWASINRGQEIQAWIDSYLENGNYIDNFVIVDDDCDMCHLIDHLVQTKNDYGLTYVEAEHIIKKLNLEGTI